MTQQYPSIAAQFAAKHPNTSWTNRIAALAAYDAWTEAEDESYSVATATALLHDLRDAFDKVEGASAVTSAADALLAIYRDFEGDTDGEATMALHEATDALAL